jgi:hypothetical protein
MNLLARKLSELSKKQDQSKMVMKPVTYNGFTFREVMEFENSIIEVHNLVQEKFEETKNFEFAAVALDCLKAINDMEKIKSQLVIK